MNASRNIYKDDVDFSVLALQAPDFNKYLKSNGQLDFSNPDAVQQLTKSLLKRDFGLNIDLPNDRLCPPVPNRLNYIIWIQDLLDTTSEGYTDRYDEQRDVVGLDIGTGSSCIYPLLGCSQRKNWKFAATDIDEKNMHYARHNILANSFKSRIRPLKTTNGDPLIPLDILGLESIDFTVCNPPFYDSRSELLASAAAKSRPPHSACTGADIEMVTPGGEVAFVTRMIEDSVSLKERVQWYTSMLGKFSSVGIIVEKLKGKGVRNWAVKELVQGERTRRWAIGWSWTDLRPTMDIARGVPALPKHLLPFPSQYSFSLMSTTPEAVAKHADTTLRDLDIRWQYRPSISTGIGFAMVNVWSRSARRSKQKKEMVSRQSAIGQDTATIAEDLSEDEAEPSLGFKIHFRHVHESDAVEVLVRWLKGRESDLFESFCGMLKRQITQHSA